MVTGNVVNKINKQILQTEHKLLRVPTGGKLTRWLFTQRGRVVELGTIEKKLVNSRVEDLNQGPSNFKSSNLNHSVVPPPQTASVPDFCYSLG